MEYIYIYYTLASISDVRVALVMLQAFADIAVGHVGTRTVATNACVAQRRLLSFCWASSVSDGEIDDIGHAPRKLVAGVAVQVSSREVIP
jgi:hypothetical protein